MRYASVIKKAVFILAALLFFFMVVGSALSMNDTRLFDPNYPRYHTMTQITPEEKASFLTIEKPSATTWSARNNGINRFQTCYDAKNEGLSLGKAAFDAMTISYKEGSQTNNLLRTFYTIKTQTTRSISYPDCTFGNAPYMHENGTLVNNYTYICNGMLNTTETYWEEHEVTLTQLRDTWSNSDKDFTWCFNGERLGTYNSNTGAYDNYTGTFWVDHYPVLAGYEYREYDLWTAPGYTVLDKEDNDTSWNGTTITDNLDMISGGWTESLNTGNKDYQQAADCPTGGTLQGSFCKRIGGNDHRMVYTRAGVPDYRVDLDIYLSDYVRLLLTNSSFGSGSNVEFDWDIIGGNRNIYERSNVDTSIQYGTNWQTLSDNTWYHIVIIHTSDPFNLSIYANDILVGYTTNADSRHDLTGIGLMSGGWSTSADIYAGSIFIYEPDNVSSNNAPTADILTIINTTQYLGNDILFIVNASDDQGISDIHNVTIEINGDDYTLNLTFNGSGDNRWRTTWTVPSTIDLGINFLNITVTDSQNAFNEIGNATNITILNNTLYANTSLFQFSTSTKLNKTSTLNISMLKQIAIANNGQTAQDFSIVTTLPNTTIQSTIIVTNSSGAQINYTYNDTSYVINWTEDSVTTDYKGLYNITFDIQALQTSNTSGNCTPISSLSWDCSFHYNITNKHNQILDNIPLYFATEDLPHIGDILGNIVVTINNITAEQPGTYAKDIMVLNLNSGNFTSSNYTIYLNTTQTGGSGGKDGGGGYHVLGGGEEGQTTTTSYILTDTNSTNTTGSYDVNNTGELGQEEYQLGSVSTIVDLSADTTYQFTVTYTATTVPGGEASSAAGGAGGLGGGSENVTIVQGKASTNLIDTISVFFIDNRSWTYDINYNKVIKSCEVDTPGWACLLLPDSNKVTIIHHVNMNNSLARIDETKLIVTAEDGEIITLPIRLRLWNIGVYFGLPTFLQFTPPLTADMFFAPLLFQKQEQTITGVRAWWVITLILAVSAFIGVKYYINQKRSQKRREKHIIARFFGLK